MDQKEVNELLVSSPIGKTIKPSYDVLEQRVKELEAELNLVDMSLARRERLDDCPDRYSKIEKMCSENGRLKAENHRLEEQLAHFKECYASLAEAHDKAQLERGGGDVE